jgi:hypothetical protein
MTRITKESMKGSFNNDICMVAEKFRNRDLLVILTFMFTDGDDSLRFVSYLIIQVHRWW